MAVAKPIQENACFYKYILDTPEVVEKPEGKYLHPLFFLVYFNLLNIYRIEEPNHHLLEAHDDGNRYYSDMLKNPNELPQERSQMNNFFSSNRLFEKDFAYEEVEVENTLLLQYLLENYGKKYYKQKFHLTSRRKRSYQFTHVPHELSSVFRILNINEGGDNSNRAYYGTGSANFSRDAKNKSKTFYSVSSNTETLSLYSLTYNIFKDFPFLHKDSANGVDTLSKPAILEIQNGSVAPRYNPDGYTYRSDGSAPKVIATPPLSELLLFFKKEKEFFFNNYFNISIRPEITTYINERMTNENKKEMSRFFSSSIGFVDCKPVPEFYNYGYQTSMNFYLDELRFGVLGQLFYLQKMDEEFKNGILSSSSTRDVYTFSASRSPFLVYKPILERREPDKVLPQIAVAQKSIVEQLSLLQEEGAPA